MDRLGELAARSALLGSALSELRGPGISNALADALATVDVADAEFDEFLGLAARDVPEASVFGLALSLPDYLEQRGAGRDALDHCLGVLAARQLDHVATRMEKLTAPEPLMWWHDRLTTVVRDDACYHRFLVRHLDLVLSHSPDELAAYLLHPDRGPGSLNLDAFELVVRRVPDPDPYFRRWHEWIWNGYFDLPRREGSEHAAILYRIFTERWNDPHYTCLRNSAHDRLLLLLQSRDLGRQRIALHHLSAMVEASYRGADDIRRGVYTRVDELPADLGLLTAHLDALAAIARWHANPADPTLKAEVDERRRALLDVRPA
jgi:hypothetical protein